MTQTNQLKTFEAPALGNLKFTVWDREGEPWFVAKEVCAAVGLELYSGPSRWTASLPKDEKAKVTRKELPALFTGSRAPSYLMIAESGLYKLIMRSNKPEAKEFQDWVTKVVLPAIRKDGAYIEGEEKLASGEMSEEEFVLKAMEIMHGKIERLKAENQQYGPYWDELTP